MEEVWAEDGEGKPVPESLLQVHHGSRLSRPQASKLPSPRTAVSMNIKHITLADALHSPIRFNGVPMIVRY